MSNGENESKTENATNRRIKRARDEGRNSYSNELNSILLLSFCFSFLWFFKRKIVLELLNIIRNCLVFDHTLIFNNLDVLKYWVFFYEKISVSFIPLFVGVFVISCISPVVFGGAIVKFRAIKFKFVSLDSFFGFKKMFSINTYVELIKIVLKIFFIFLFNFFYFFMCDFNLKQLFSLSMYTPINGFIESINIFKVSMLLCFLGFFPIVILDVLWKNFDFYKQLRMSREEIREESKETNGNPETKMRIRKAMRLAIRNRILANVPKSDVIITNPIHYSIAIKYDEETMLAPVIISKGIGILALKIQSVAKKNNIPIFESPRLARSLYYNTDVGHHIPWTLYKVLAEVLAWVWKLKKWKKEGGDYPKKPLNILVP